MKIKVDIDNCIRDCGSAMVKLYNQTYGTSLTKEDIIDYDMDIAFPLLKQTNINAFNFFFVDHINEIFTNAEAMPGAVNGLDLLRWQGHEVVIVSYQPTSQAKLETLKWLDKHNISYDEIIFTNNPTKLVVDCDVIIDDHMKYLDEVSKKTKTVCVDWAYNRSKKYDFRVKSILEYAVNLCSE